MPSLETIHRFLDQPTIAFVGASRDPKAFATTVLRRLRDDGRGRTVIPVNPAAGGEPIEGTPSYPTLRDLPLAVDGAVVQVPADQVGQVVDDAIAAGVPMLWLHRGAGQKPVDPAAVQRARDAGIEVVDGACPLMFDEPVRGIHRLHRGMVRRRFTTV